jgi:homoserine dehydrogenase
MKKVELKRTIRIGLIGVGTVGTGTAKVLLDHRPEIERRVGCRLELKTLCSRNIHKKDLSWLRPPVQVTADWREVVRDPEIDIVVELVGEKNTALAIARASLGGGKHLVTANKQLVAEHGMELATLSRSAGVNLGIEACVAGGTPILHAIREGLSGERFQAVYGILNGTTNYILTEMERRQTSFAGALAEAQRKGFAEPDPTFDVEGYDARYKIAILTMICFGQVIPVDEIPTEGIRSVEPVDFAYAYRLDNTIRLIAGARLHSAGRLEIFVRPMMIPRSSSLAAVTGSTNGILLVGSKGGQTLVTGRGAGGEPTGVAVVSDVVQTARAILRGGVREPLGYTEWRRGKVLPSGKRNSAAYLRLVVKDRPGILAKVCSILARHGINIDAVMQEPAHPKKALPFVMTLEITEEKNLRAAVAQIAKLPFFARPPLLMPFAGEF